VQHSVIQSTIARCNILLCSLTYHDIFFSLQQNSVMRCSVYSKTVLCGVQSTAKQCYAVFSLQQNSVMRCSVYSRTVLCGVQSTCDTENASSRRRTVSCLHVHKSKNSFCAILDVGFDVEWDGSACVMYSLEGGGS
jgi:hypothetical protein